MAALMKSRATALSGSRPSVAAAAPCRCLQRSRRSLRVAAEQNGLKNDAFGMESFRRSCDRFFTRYDFLSTGMGAMCVTGYCVAKGQDPGTAATITVAATVGALVLNELLFSSESQQ